SAKRLWRVREVDKHVKRLPDIDELHPTRCAGPSLERADSLIHFEPCRMCDGICRERRIEREVPRRPHSHLMSPAKSEQSKTRTPAVVGDLFSSNICCWAQAVPNGASMREFPEPLGRRIVHIQDRGLFKALLRARVEHRKQTAFRR